MGSRVRPGAGDRIGLKDLIPVLEASGHGWGPVPILGAPRDPSLSVAAAILAGLTLGALCVWAIRKSGRLVARRWASELQPRTAATRKAKLILASLYVGAVAWLVVSDVIAYQFTKNLIQLLRMGGVNAG